MITEKGYLLLSIFVENGDLRTNEFRDILKNRKEFYKISHGYMAIIKELIAMGLLDKKENENPAKNLHALYGINEDGEREYKKYKNKRVINRIKNIPLFNTQNIISFLSLIVAAIALWYSRYDSNRNDEQLLKLEHRVKILENKQAK